MDNQGIRFNRIGIVLGALALMIAISYQGLSESGGGGSTAFVNPPAGSNNSTNQSFSGSVTVSNLFIGTGNGQIISTNSAGTNQFGTTKFFPGGPSGDYVYFTDPLGNPIGIIQTNSFQGFRLGSTNNGPMLSFRSSTGLIMLSNANFQVNGNAAIDGNSTFGDAASDSVTFNAGTATTVGGLNYNTSTMFITNGGVSFGTNLIATTEAVRIQGAGVSGVALTVVQSPGGGAVGMQVWKTANGTTVMQVSSNGNLLVGNGALSATGYNGLNSGGTVSFINNTASTGSSTDVGGGTGTSAKTTISASGAKLGSFSTNVIQLNAVNFQATTNSSTVGPNLMATVNLIPGSIGTNSFYSTNFPVTGSITNGAYMKIVPGGGALDQYLLVDVSCKTNGTITLYINNRDPNIAHTPSNGTYGVFGVMPSL